jgi:hypothetical protein
VGRLVAAEDMAEKRKLPEVACTAVAEIAAHIAEIAAHIVVVEETVAYTLVDDIAAVVESDLVSGRTLRNN